MVRIVATVPNFDSKVHSLDKSLVLRLKKLMDKIIENPNIGKPMRYERKGTREVYMKPFRLSYSYDPNADRILFIDLYHKKHQ